MMETVTWRYVVSAFYPWLVWRGGGGGGGALSEKFGGVCGLIPKTFILFKTKSCDFPYPF